MAFIPWNFEPNNTLMHEEGLVEYGTGGVQLLKMIAISRLVFDGLIQSHSIFLVDKWSWYGSTCFAIWC